MVDKCLTSESANFGLFFNSISVLQMPEFCYFLVSTPHQFLTMTHMFSIISEVHLMSVTFGHSRRGLTFLDLSDIKFAMSKYELYLERCALSIFTTFCSSSSNCHHAMAQGLKGGKSLHESTRNQRPQSTGKDAFLQCLHET